MSINLYVMIEGYHQPRPYGNLSNYSYVCVGVCEGEGLCLFVCVGVCLSVCVCVGWDSGVCALCWFVRLCESDADIMVCACANISVPAHLCV